MALGLGCNTATDSLADPSWLRADLALVQTVFAAPVVQATGFVALVPPFPAPAAGGPLIPDSLLGKTLAWSCASQRYAATTDSGAPLNGVRLRLYQLAATGAIACPATAIGQLDLVDASSAAGRAVHAIATIESAGAPVIDYTLTRGADSARTTSASGLVSDGQERLTFQWTSRSGAFNVSFTTAELDDSARDFHVVLQDSSQMGVDTYGEDLDLALRHADLTLELKGSTGWGNFYSSWDEAVTVNGEPYAKIGGTTVPDGGRPTLTPADGFPFTSDQRQLLFDVVDTPGNLRTDFYRLLGAGTRLVYAP